MLYSVKDKDLNYLVYDIGVSSNRNDFAWDNITNFSEFIRGSNGTTVTNNTGLNKYLIANITSGTTYDFTTPFRVEFNFEKLNTSTANTQIQMNNEQNDYFANWLTTTGHYMIDVEENEVTWTVNGQALTGKTVTLGTVFVRFYLANGTSMKFSDFIIYKIQ